MPTAMIAALAGFLAGLGEIGYSKVFLSPKFGPRIRLAAMLTDLELEPDPIIKPGTICNKCMACARACPGHSISMTKTVKVRLAGYDVEWGDADARNIWFATCTTAHGTAAKVATSTTGDFVLATGNMVRVKFSDYNNQTQPTISIDGSEAKRIKSLSTETNIITSIWHIGEVVDLVYDGTDFLMSEGGLASTSYYGVTKLSTSTSSTSQSLAATPSAVKDAYDLAASKVDAAGAAAAAPVQSVNGLTGNVNIPTVAVQGSTPTGGELVWVDTDEPGTTHELLEMSDFDSADGHCKMPDGTLIQWGTVTLTSGSTSTYVSPINTATVVIQFPIPFVSTDYMVFGSGKYSTGASTPIGQNIAGETLTTCSVHWWDATARAFSASIPLRVKWCAIGRWK